MPGSSILMISAPRSPSIIAQNGPAWTWETSITRIPSRGFILWFLLDRAVVRRHDTRLAVALPPAVQSNAKIALRKGGWHAIILCATRAGLKKRSEGALTMRAKTREGREIDLKQDTLDGLKMRLRGPIFVPGDAGYEESRTVWNAMIDRKPAVVARCLGVADVIACVRFARENDRLLCIKGGGHNIAGLATADGALMIDMSLMRGVWVDPLRRVAHAQAGCLLG